MPEETITPSASAGVDHAQVEATRVAGLKRLRTQYPDYFNEQAERAAIDLGVSVAAASERVADAVIAASQRHNVNTIGDDVLGDMSERELNRYSLRNVYVAAVNERFPGTYAGKEFEAGFEREVSQTIRKKAESRGVEGLGNGILTPSFSSSPGRGQQRTVAAGGNAGAASNFTVVEAQPIELLRNRVALLAMGAQMMSGLQGIQQMPRQNAATSSNWLAELGGATKTDPGFDFITLSPKRLSIANSYTRDFLTQSRLAIESILAQDRLAVLSRALDTAGLAGSGVAPVPKGLLNQSGLTAVLAGSVRNANGTVTAGAGGVPMTFVDYNNIEAAISTANGDIGSLGWITTPKIRAAGRSTPQITGGTAIGFIWPNSPVAPNGTQEGPLGYKALCTSNSVLTGFTANSVSGLHAVLLGVWDQVLFGDWGFSEVIVDPYTQAASAVYNITEHAFYDVNFRHLESFAACISALPS